MTAAVLSDLQIPLADGTRLSGDLYLPEGHAPGPVPGSP